MLEQNAAAELTCFAVVSRPSPISLGVIRCEAAIGCMHLLLTLRVQVLGPLRVGYCVLRCESCDLHISF